MSDGIWRRIRSRLNHRGRIDADLGRTDKRGDEFPRSDAGRVDINDSGGSVAMLYGDGAVGSESDRSGSVWINRRIDLGEGRRELFGRLGDRERSGRNPGELCVPRCAGNTKAV